MACGFVVQVALDQITTNEFDHGSFWARSDVKTNDAIIVPLAEKQSIGNQK
jgi:hypothetical protein